MAALPCLSVAGLVLEFIFALLGNDGVMATNTFSSSRLYSAESATYASVFGPFYKLKTENRVILAKNGGLPSLSELQANAARVDERLQRFGTGKEGLLPLFATGVQWPAGTRILTDRYSPPNLLNGQENQTKWWRFW